MIEILPQRKGMVVGTKARGTLTDQDYQDVLIPHLEKTIEDVPNNFSRSPIETMDHFC